MKIKPMLVRLQSAIGRDDLIEQMVLLPEPHKPCSLEVQAVNLIVAYDASPNSHTALDLAFCIAHQTRLATNAPVNVQAIYVVENHDHNQFTDLSNFTQPLPTLECSLSAVSSSDIPVLTQSKLRGITQFLAEKTITSLQEADRILWQARSLAEEWQGSFKSHLRFGCVATELKKVVQLEAADILFLGCKSVNHSMIKILGSNFPCAVLGIPNGIDE